MHATKTTTQATVVVKPGLEQQVRELRAQRDEIRRNVDDLTATQIRIADTSPRGWDDERIAKIEVDIDKAEDDIVRVRAKIAACMIVLPQVEQIIAAGHVA